LGNWEGSPEFIAMRSVSLFSFKPPFTALTASVTGVKKQGSQQQKHWGKQKMI